MGIGDFVAGITAAIVGRLAGEELKEWAPTLAHKIALAAAARAPEDLRERLSEEWLGHLNEVPGRMSQIFVAVGFVLAARRLNGISVVGQLLAVVAAVYFFPLFLLVGVILRTSVDGRLLRPVTWRWAQREAPTITFTTNDSAVGRFVREFDIDTWLAAIWAAASGAIPLKEASQGILRRR